jgi:pyrroloquinoline quinone biosynthesis protein E
MDSRAASDSVRIYTWPMKPENVLSLLSSLSWTGDPQPAQRVMDAISPYVFGGKFILSFDLFRDRISEKIGINFPPRQNKPGTLQALLAHLEDDWDCLPEKCDALMDWNQEKPIPETRLQNDISHIKFTIEEGEVRMIKAYLRQSDERRVSAPQYRAHRHPQLMNLELTTRCPLHCPQCYVHLNTGEEMQLDTALYWLREGKKAGIITVCLSGGETLCYSHLPELIRECRKLGLTSAISLSGIYADKECLKGLIGDGVSEIFISLNGSTEEINRRTRDGYQLAIDALQNLKELGFEHTCINWVMSKENAQDLPDMISLCEQYQVKLLAILAFKPDSAYEWERFPSVAQMKEAARQIKAYRGPVEVAAESCFSQMRALLGRSALAGNLNRGIRRGCCAGRDQISVSVDGKLTPCRHLDVREEYDSILEYWEKSPFLAELRKVEDKRREPCLGCRYENNCLPCNAVGYKLQGEFTYGLTACELGQAEREGR